MAEYHIYNEDCLNGMKRIREGSVDCVIYDLPYGVTKCEWDVPLPLDELWLQYKRVCKNNAAIVLFGTEPFSSTLRLSNINAYKYDWIWEKNNVSGFLNAKKQPLRSNELISVFYQRQCTYNPQMTNEKHQRKMDGIGKTTSTIYNKQGTFNRTTSPLAYPKSVLHFHGIINNSKEKVAHPTQKPIDLIRYLVRTYTNEGDIVLDNCMGSGTTGVACIIERRNFIGFEIDENYYRIAERRLKEQSAYQSLF